MGLIIFLIVGAVAGFLAGVIMRGRGFGLLGNLVVGIIGAYLGGFLAKFVGIAAYGFIGEIIVSTAGAVALLFLIGLIFKR